MYTFRFINTTVPLKRSNCHSLCSNLQGGKHAHYGNAHHQGQPKKHEDIVPWGWEHAAKDERRKKAEQAAADAAARKAAREYDPAMTVKEKVAKSQPDDKKGKNGTKAAPGGGAGPAA